MKALRGLGARLRRAETRAAWALLVRLRGGDEVKARAEMVRRAAEKLAQELHHTRLVDLPIQEQLVLAFAASQIFTTRMKAAGIEPRAVRMGGGS